MEIETFLSPAGEKYLLYIFLTIDSLGSRILIVTSSESLVDKVKTGQLPLRYLMEQPVVIAMANKQITAGGPKAKIVLQSMSSLASNALSQTLENEDDEVEAMLEHSQYLNQTGLPKKPKGKVKSAQIPWLVVTFSFVLPKVTLTWTVEGEVIIALDLGTVKLSAICAPKRLKDWGDGLPEFDNLLNDHPGKQFRKAISRHPTPTEKKEPFNVEEFRQTLITFNPNIVLSGNIGSNKTTTDHQTEKTPRNVFRELDMNEWKLRRRRQHKCYLDLKTRISTNSWVLFDFTISQINCEHFVEGDIPVILKSTNDTDGNLYTLSSKKNCMPFVALRLVKCVVDPSFAPLYENIEVRKKVEQFTYLHKS